MEASQAPAVSVLSSKLAKPEISGKLVPRAVYKQFARKLLDKCKVGLVVAPAGYGKSTLLSQSINMLTTKGAQCAWLSLDAKDNDPLRFFAHLLAALDSFDSINFQLGTEHQATNSKTNIDHLVADTLAKLETLDYRHVLFLDDYHVIDNPEVHDILERLVLYFPQNTHLVIASRKEPEIALKSLRMHGELCELSAHELTFSLDESEKFLNENKELNLNPQVVEALNSRTEGWVAGLQLASLALTGRTDSEAFVKEFSGTDRDVTDYLGEAVLNQQSEEIKRFLLWTSLLERMNASMVNAVLDTENGQTILEELEARNLFVIPLDRERNWYRYHHLFGDFLSAHLSKQHPEVVKDIYQHAVNWCIEQDLQHEAIHYALRGGFHDQAIELIAEIAKDLVEVFGEHWTLLHWVQQLPEDYAAKRPQIAMVYSWSLLFTRRPAEARELLVNLKAFCEEKADELEPALLQQLRCGIDMNLCMAEIVSDNTEHASDLAKQWIAAYPDAEPRYRLTVHIFQAYVALSTFETELGTIAGNKAIAIGQEYAMDYLEAWAHSATGLLKLKQADLEGAVRHSKQGLETNNRKSSPHSFVGSLNAVVLAEAYYEKNELDKAEVLLEDRFEYIDNESVVDVAYAGYRTLAKLQIIRNGLESGLKVLRLGRESATQAKLPRLSTMLTALEIRSLLKAGQSKEARTVAKEQGFDDSLPPSLAQPLRPAVEEIRKLVQAALYIDSKRPQRALNTLNEFVPAVESSVRVRRQLEILLLRFKALQALKRVDEAKTDLIHALNIGTAGNLYRVFLDAGEEVHQMLGLLLKEDIETLSVDTVQFLGSVNTQLQADRKSQSAATKQNQSTDSLLEPLTKRERQILDTITSGETNKEIGEKLFISEQTVKWHLHQLYQKLGVKNRTGAIAKATALSLI